MDLRDAQIKSKNFIDKMFQDIKLSVDDMPEESWTLLITHIFKMKHNARSFPLIKG